jgi:hypothetical protein
MKITKPNKNCYQASRITGPKHNFLALTFGDNESMEIIMEDLSQGGKIKQ